MLNSNTATHSVLLIADSAPMRRGLAGQCRMLGYSPLEAVPFTLVAEQAARAEVALIRVASAGWRAAVAALKRLAPGLPCCLVSSDATPSQEELQTAGVDGVLHEPFTLAEVSACLRSMSDEASTKRNRPLPSVCAWCGQVITKPTRSAEECPADRVSHGICPDCYRKALATTGSAGQDS